MMNAAAPRVGGERIAPMPGRREHAAGRLAGVAGPLEDRPGERAQRHRGRRAGAGHGAEQEAGGGHGAARGGAGAAEQREAELDEEAARAHPVEDRAVDREQHDVRRGDVERDAEEPAGLVVEAVDDLLEVHADVRDGPVDRQVAAVVGVGEEHQADRGQHHARRTAGGLEDQHQQHRAGDDVEQEQRALPVEEAGEASAAEVGERQREDRVEADDERDRRQHPVEDPGVVLARGGPHGGCGGGRALGGGGVRGVRDGPLRGADPVAEEDQRQGDAEEQDQVVLAALLQRGEHLAQHEQRHREAPDPHEPVDPGGEVAGRTLLVVVGDQLVDVEAFGRHAGGALRRHAR